MKIWKKAVMMSMVLGFGLATLSAEALNVGVVNIQKALIETKKGKSAQASLNAEITKRRGEVEKLQSEVQKMNEAFQKKASVLSDKARNEEGMKIQQKLAELQGLQQQSQVEFQQKELEMTRPIIEGLRKLIPEISRKRKMDLVFEASSGVLLYSKSQTDLTEELIALYDEKNK